MARTAVAAVILSLVAPVIVPTAVFGRPPALVVGGLPSYLLAIALMNGAQAGLFAGLALGMTRIFNLLAGGRRLSMRSIETVAVRAGAAGMLGGALFFTATALEDDVSKWSLLEEILALGCWVWPSGVLMVILALELRKNGAVRVEKRRKE